MTLLCHALHCTDATPRLYCAYRIYTPPHHTHYLPPHTPPHTHLAHTGCRNEHCRLGGTPFTPHSYGHLTAQKPCPPTWMLMTHSLASQSWYRLVSANGNVSDIRPFALVPGCPCCHVGAGAWAFGGRGSVCVRASALALFTPCLPPCPALPRSHFCHAAAARICVCDAQQRRGAYHLHCCHLVSLASCRQLPTPNYYLPPASLLCQTVLATFLSLFSRGLNASECLFAVVSPVYRLAS